MDCMCNSVTSSYTCTEECSRSVTDNCFYGNHGNLTGLLVQAEGHHQLLTLRYMRVGWGSSSLWTL